MAKKRKGRKLQGLTPQEARLRALKAWRTKHARYTYGKQKAEHSGSRRGGSDNWDWTSGYEGGPKPTSPEERRQRKAMGDPDRIPGKQLQFDIWQAQREENAKRAEAVSERVKQQKASEKKKPKQPKGKAGIQMPGHGARVPYTTRARPKEGYEQRRNQILDRLSKMSDVPSDNPKKRRLMAELDEIARREVPRQQGVADAVTESQIGGYSARSRELKRIQQEADEQGIPRVGGSRFGTPTYEISLEELIAHEREQNKRLTVDELLEAPAMKAYLKQLPSEEYGDVKKTLLAHHFAEQRAKTQSVDPYEMTPRETSILTAAANQLKYNLGKSDDRDTYFRAVAADLRAAAGPDASPGQIVKTARAITKFKMESEGTPHEAADRLELSRVLTRFATETQRESDRRSEMRLAAKMEQEIETQYYRQRQGEIKFGQVTGLKHELANKNWDKPWSALNEEQKNSRVAEVKKKLTDTLVVPADPIGRALADPQTNISFGEKVGPYGSSGNIEAGRESLAMKSRVGPEGFLATENPSGKGSLVDDIAVRIAKGEKAGFDDKGNPTPLQERFDYLRISTATAWDPAFRFRKPETGKPRNEYDQVMENYASEAARAQRGPRRVVQTSEEFYRASGHERDKGVKGIRSQGRFIKEQLKNRKNAVRSGDYYMGWDAQGKPAEPNRAAFGITSTKQWEYRTPTGKRRHVAFGDTRTEVEDAELVGLTTKFGDTLNINIGARKARPEYDAAPELGRRIDKDLVVPMHSLKSTQTRYRDRTYFTEDDEGRKSRNVEKVRVRYMPYDHTKTSREDPDQIAIKIPGKGRFGERAVFANFGTNDSEMMSNVSKYALGPVRAREERLFRERSAQQARLRDVEMFGMVKTEPNLGMNQDESFKFARAVGGAGVAATGFGLRRRATKVWAPKTINKASTSIASRSPRYRRFMEDLNKKNFKWVDVKEGAVRPFEENIGRAKYMVRHPLSSPEGLATGLGVDTGYYRKDLIHPQLYMARQLKKERLEMEAMHGTSKFFESAASHDAPRWKRTLARHRDPRKRDQSYKEFLRNPEIRFERARNMALEGFSEEPHKTLGLSVRGKQIIPEGKTTIRSRRAHRALQKESHILNQTVYKIRHEQTLGKPKGLMQGPRTRAGEGPKGMELVLYNPDSGGGPKYRPTNVYGKGISPSSRNMLIGAGVVATAAGAAYLYHRHKQKKEREAGEVPQSFYNRMLPGPISVPLPYARATSRYVIGDHPVAKELGLARRKIPTQVGVGIQKRNIWKGTPADRGYDPTLPLVGRPGFKTPRAGRTSDKIFRSSEAMNRKRLRTRGTHDVLVRGRKVPITFTSQEQAPVKLRTRNPNAISSKDRENLVYAYGLSEIERLYQPQNYRRQEDYRNVRDFYTSGISDDKLLRKLEDPEEVYKIRKKKNANLGRQPAGQLIRMRSPEGEIYWTRTGGTSRRAAKDQRLADLFGYGAGPQSW